MNPLIFTIKRVTSLLEEINHLKESEFPYPHSKNALDILDEHFQTINKRLQGRDPNNQIIQNYLPNVLRDLFIYLPILGFILRSTNVRNSFEIYRPLLRLVKEAIEPKISETKRKTKLILSSEWNFSPYVYPDLYSLEGFILIGIPASESSNALLIPLVGHELGHPLWNIKKIEDEIKIQITEEIIKIINNQWNIFKIHFPEHVILDELKIDIFALEIWSPAISWALQQAQESFSDFIGIRIFGESFLHAFAYLLTPGISGERSIIYPLMKTRIENQIKAINYFKYNNIQLSDYSTMFYEDVKDDYLTETDKFRLELADKALSKIIDILITKADEIITQTNIPKPNFERSQKILKKFKKLSPATECQSLVDIINAAWMAFADDEIWENSPKAKENKDIILKELVLKNIEVFEIEQLQKEEEEI